MAAVDEIEAAILEDPDQTDAYLVLADTLLERGDPRGELIVVQHQLLARPDDAALRQHERRLIDAALQELGGLPLRAVEWRLGFIRRAELDVAKQPHPDRTLRALLDHPSAQLMTELRVSCGWGDATLPIDALAERPRPGLRGLALLEELGDHEPGCRHAPDRLWPMLPKLERLHLRSERPLFHSVVHPRIERLDLDVGPLCDEGRWLLPSLRVLDWDPHIEAEVDIGVFDRLWEQELPALRELVLRGALVAFAPTLERPEVRRFISRLEHLCVPADGLLPYRGDVLLAEQLVANASHLDHLASMTVTGVDPETAGDLVEARRRLPRLVLDEGGRPRGA
jgi:uncharacterized protein (TIGR02996 family)